MLTNFSKTFFRKKSPIIFNELTRANPICTDFGFTRGTPIDRYYIEKFLQENSNMIKGNVLEIADSHYCRLFGGSKVTTFEVLHATSENSKATIVGDLTDHTTLPENFVDCFVCTQTFNFIFNVQKAIEGACYILKPGGTLLATVAGISQISRYDMERWGDYWRFTTASIKRLFEPIFTGGCEIISYGNVLAATAFLQGIAVQDLPNPALLDEADPDYQVIIAIAARKGEIK